MKILSPAGNMESLKAAVYNGADEVYLGINEFNARNNIDGFTMETLKSAIDFAHVFGVKVCLAVNILFDDTEIQRALDLVVDAYNLGVDAFIVQDLGLISLISVNYPDIEIHASTQMGIHNLEGVRFLQKFGVKRLVLSRETPISEIKRIRKNSDVEIEYFVQGALCVSFSGNCYMSSYFLNASGNRGRCKQLCRLPFTLSKDGKRIKKGYLLSAKDFNMIDRLEELEDAGVDVLKIEGRARRPFYVAAATRQYYNALNKLTVDHDNLSIAFNRGYTAGYFDGNGKIISEYNNHVGIKVGVVEKVKGGKTFNEVFFNSFKKLSPKSTFKFFVDGKEQCTVTAFDLKEIEKGKYRITTTSGVQVGATVRLIVDYDLEKELLSKIKKINLPLNLRFTEQSLSAEFTVFNKKITVKGEAPYLAKNQPLSKKEIEDNFSKSEYFQPVINQLELGNVFVPKQKLNAFRRDVYDAAYRELTEKNRRNISKVKLKKASGISFDDFEIVTDISSDFVKTNVIYSPEEYFVLDVQKFCDKCKSQNKKPYLDTPNFALEKDVEILQDIVDKTGIGIVANNYYALSLKGEIIVGAGLNVYNEYSAESLNLPIISAESDLFSRIKFPYMTLRHCPIKSHVYCDCNKCKYTDGYVYTADDGRKMKLKRKKLTTCTFYLVD